ncbi:MAG: AsmA-like C-terminal domain-containing protein [Helicobacteraceae bacterium]|nr:AsmA-like C-terminal domain-containing protein [Helicobacteraceae bacterium]
MFVGFGFEKLDYSGFEAQNLRVEINPRIVISADKITIGKEVFAEDKSPPKERDPKSIIRAVKWAFIGLLIVDRISIGEIEIDLPGSPLTRLNKTRVNYDDGVFLITGKEAAARVTLGWLGREAVAFEVREAWLTDYNVSLQASGYAEILSGRFFAEATYKTPYAVGSLGAWGNPNRVFARFGDTNLRNLRADNQEINATLRGFAEFDLDKMQGKFDGDADAIGINGHLAADFNLTDVKFTVSGAQAKSLSGLAGVLPVPKKVKEWIHGNVRAKNFNINRYEIALNLANFSVDFANMYLDAEAEEADIWFNDYLPSASAKELEIFIKKNGIYIDAKGAIYEDQEANAKFWIENLFTDNKMLFLNIETSALFDKSMRKLLAEMATDIDFEQISGENKVNFDLKIDMQKDEISINTTLVTKNGEMVLFGFPLPYNDAKVNITQEGVRIERVDLKIAEVTKAIASGVIDTAKKTIDLEFDLRDVGLYDKLLISASELKVKLLGNWNEKETKLTLPEFNTEIIMRRDNTETTISDISPLKNISPPAEIFALSGGKFKMIKNKEGLRAFFTILTEQPFLYADGEPLKRISGSVNLNDQKFTLSAIKGRYKIYADQNFIKHTLESLEMDIEELAKFTKTRQEKFPSGSQLDDRKVFVIGDNSGLRFKNHKLIAKNLSFFKESDMLKGVLRDKNSSIVLDKRGDEFTLRGENLDSVWVRELTSVRMRDGKWSFNARGSLRTEDFYGQIVIEKTTIESARVLTNVIALINTLPALVQFRSPGFSSRGFKINEGLIEFYYSDGILYIIALRLIGDSSDILAQGSIDLNADQVDIFASIQSAKAASSLISSIPLVGYLLLGDSRRIENILHITGTMDAPKVEAKLAKELALYPLGVLGRVITLPAKPFRSDKKPK